MIKAVIYDMDGVILDSEPFWQEAEIAIFKKEGLKLTHEDCMKTMGLRTDEVIKYWAPQFTKQTRSNDELQQDIYHAVKALIVEKGCLLPGVIESLEFFKALRFKIALATSSPRLLIDAVLDTFGIRSYFVATATANDEEHGKPHPAVYITAAKSIQVAPESCLAIEDSFNGLLAAKSAKMKTIAIPDAHFKNDKRFIIADLTLASLLDVNPEVISNLV